MATSEEESDGLSVQGGRFVTTHWSVVLRAGLGDSPAAEAALSDLCRTYWYPLYAFVRRQGHRPHDAEDLTQGFFARLLDKKYLATADQAKGKFRTFLLMVLKRFLANEWDWQHAQKRGGFQPIVSIDQEQAEARLAAEPSCEAAPDVLFDQQWAAALLEKVIGRLSEEYASTGRSAIFGQLRGCLVPGGVSRKYSEIAERLHLTESAVKMAVQRMRARYRQILREEISQTVMRPEDVDDEIRHLFATFGRR